MDTVIDWQRLVDYTEGLLLKQALKYVMAQIVQIPYVGWVLNNPITRMMIEWVIKQVIRSMDTTLFKFNMDLLKSDQFKDYRKDVAALYGAAETLPDDEWEKLEDAANESFLRANRLIA